MLHWSQSALTGTHALAVIHSLSVGVTLLSQQPFSVLMEKGMIEAERWH